jgi:hypothetical protein
MPLHIPSVDLTRSRGDEHRDLTFQKPLEHPTYYLHRNLKKMVKDGWHVHTLTDEGVGRGQAHTGRYKVVYEK